MWCRCMRRTVRFHYGSAFAKLPLDRKLVYVMEIDLHFLSSKLLMWIMLYEIVEKILKLRVYKTSCYSSVWEPHGSFSPQLYELWCEAGEKGDAYRSQALSVCSYLKDAWGIYGKRCQTLPPQNCRRLVHAVVQCQIKCSWVFSLCSVALIYRPLGGCGNQDVRVLLQLYS